MKKFPLGCLANLLLFSGCSIFERPVTLTKPPEQPKKLNKILEPEELKAKLNKREDTGGTQSQSTTIDDQHHSAAKYPPEQIAESSTELLEKKFLDKELLETKVATKEVDHLCKQLSDKLFSVSLDQCIKQKFAANALSVLRRPLVHQDFINANPANAPRKRVLIIGGIHGDEYSSISVVFKWMAMIQENRHSIFDWRFLPSANPDGLLRNKPRRQNANNVDLNRNFLTQDWYEQATSKWRSKYNSDPRRFPGDNPGSEPEVKWIVQQIADFKPDAIISLHAPYGRVDFDGPPEGPTKLGALTAIRLGVFPGSLGNYAGVDLKIPTVTLELPSADKIPARLEISSMWQDLQVWLCNHLDEQCDAVAMPNGSGALGSVDVVHKR